MKIVIIVAADEQAGNSLQDQLPGDYTSLKSRGGDSRHLLKDLPRAPVLLDTDWPDAGEWLRQAGGINPDLVCIGVGRERERAAALQGCLYDFIPAPFEAWQLEKALERSREKLRISAVPDPAGRREPGGGDAGNRERAQQLARGYPSRSWAKVLSDFSRALSTRPDRGRFLELVLDAVIELVPAAKISILLQDEKTGDYTVAAQRGLDPGIHRNLRFAVDEGIIAWLSETGRIFHLIGPAAADREEYAAELIQEMKLIHAVVCVPIIVHGRLTGALCLGSKVTGTLFYEKELELLYTVCGSIAVALNEIELQEERKKLEANLKEREEKYRFLTENVGDIVWTIDFNLNVTYVSPALTRVLGFTPEEGMRQALDEKITPESLIRVIDVYTREIEHVKNGSFDPDRAVNLEVEYYHKNGSTVWMENNIKAFRNSKGEISAFYGVSRDITDRKKFEAELKYMSYHDQLTGLYNRHYLGEEMNRLDTERQLPIGIIMADLNGLKLVNDTYGHNIGDAMLKRAAEILQSVCRADDLLARFGGDEFVLYLPRTPHNEVQKVSDRIEKACRKEQINDVPLSLATGVAVKERAEQKLFDLLKEAEDKMYRDKLAESRSGKSAIVSSLLQALAAKSFETETHIHNMQEAASKIGKILCLHNSELRRLDLLITLHDIGKINTPEELLTKKEPLSAAEWEIMKEHSETGYRVAKATDEFAHVAEDILAHHEHWDGSGYPQGLKGKAIPLLARIIAIADGYEVMSNDRPYKKALSKSEIVAELKNCSGTLFDPELVEIFIPIIEADG